MCQTQTVLLLYNTGLQLFLCRLPLRGGAASFFLSFTFFPCPLTAEGDAERSCGARRYIGGPAHVGAVRDRLFPRPDTVEGRQEEEEAEWTITSLAFKEIKEKKYISGFNGLKKDPLQRGGNEAGGQQ